MLLSSACGGRATSLHEGSQSGSESGGAASASEAFTAPDPALGPCFGFEDVWEIDSEFSGYFYVEENDGTCTAWVGKRWWMPSPFELEMQDGVVLLHQGHEPYSGQAGFVRLEIAREPEGLQMSGHWYENTKDEAGNVMLAQYEFAGPLQEVSAPPEMEIQIDGPLDRWSEFAVRVSRPVLNLNEAIETSYGDLALANGNGWNEVHAWFLLRAWQSSLAREFTITLPAGSVELSGRVSERDVVLPVPYRELGLSKTELDFPTSDASLNNQPAACREVGCLSSSSCTGESTEEELLASLVDASSAKHLDVRFTTSSSDGSVDQAVALVQVVGHTRVLEPVAVNSEGSWHVQSYDISEEELVGVVLGAQLSCVDAKDAVHFDGVFVE